MSQKIDQLPQHRARLPRNGHPLSHDFGLTATVGHLNPIFHTIVSPGDTIKLGFDFNLRTMPLAAAAFGDLTCYTEYFFVPMQLLYQPFDGVYYNVSDQFSTLLASSELSTEFPVVDFHQATEILHQRRNRGVLGFNDPQIGAVESVGQSAIRLFDLLGYNPVAIATGDADGTNTYQPNVFPYPLLAYNCIYQYAYRLDNREKFDAQSFNYDRYYNSVATPIQEFYEPMWLMKYRPLDSDYFTDVKVSPVVDSLNLVGADLQGPTDWLSGNSNPQPVAGSQNNGIYTTFEHRTSHDYQSIFHQYQAKTGVSAQRSTKPKNQCYQIYTSKKQNHPHTKDEDQ